MSPIRITTLLSLAATLVLLHCGCAIPTGAGTQSSNLAEVNVAATAALQNLYATRPAAKTLGEKARAILIFPDVVKAGFMWGGEIGNGVLREHGSTAGYYNLTAASYGFQAGIQSFGYVLFLMNDSAIAYLNKTGGWQVGAGPSIVVVDEGMARSISTTTLQKDIYAFIFDQSGLMAGTGLQGSKITRVGP